MTMPVAMTMAVAVPPGWLGGASHARPRFLHAPAVGRATTRSTTATRGGLAAHTGRTSGQNSRHTLETRTVEHRPPGGLPQRFQLLGSLGRHGDREIGLVVTDEHLGHAAKVDDVAGEVGPLDAFQGFEDPRLSDGHWPAFHGKRC